MILTHLILPIGFFFWLWHGKEHSKLNWFVKLMVVAFYILHMFLSGQWDMLSYYLRFVLVALFTVAAIMSLAPYVLAKGRGLSSHLASVSSRVEVKLVGWKECARQYAPQLCFFSLASCIRKDLTDPYVISDGACACDRDILIRFLIAAVGRRCTSAQY
jgi:hypothetical protein